MTEALKDCILFKTDTGEFILLMENNMLFVKMTVKDLKMAERYIDLLTKCKAEGNMNSLATNKEYKRINKYFYDIGRNIKSKYVENT